MDGTSCCNLFLKQNRRELESLKIVKHGDNVCLDEIATRVYSMPVLQESLVKYYRMPASCTQITNGVGDRA